MRRNGDRSGTYRARREKKNIVTYLHIFKTVLLTYAPQDVLLTTLLHFACQQQFVKDEVCLLEVKDDVQLADIAVVFVHLFHIAVHDFQGDELIIGGGAASNEEEGGISAVDYLGIWLLSGKHLIELRGHTFVFKKVAHPRSSRQDQL